MELEEFEALALKTGESVEVKETFTGGTTAILYFSHLSTVATVALGDGLNEAGEVERVRPYAFCVIQIKRPARKRKRGSAKN